MAENFVRLQCSCSPLISLETLVSGNAPDLSQNIRKVLAKLFVAHVEAPRHVREPAGGRIRPNEPAPPGCSPKMTVWILRLANTAFPGLTRASRVGLVDPRFDSKQLVQPLGDRDGGDGGRQRNRSEPRP